jgi:RNA polymerase sigma-54 factor
MTPQLQQAIKLLQLSNIELSAYVEDELLQNPMLEREESSNPGDDAASQTADGGDAEVDDLFEPESLEHTATETMLPDADAALDIDGESVWTEDGPSDAIADNGDAAETIGTMDAIDTLDNSTLDAPSTGLSSTVSGGSREFSERVGDLEATLSDAPTLRDHLTAQLLVDIADPGDRMIGIQLIETLSAFN